jgi:hypothetical protein
MKKILFVIAKYNGDKQKFFNDYISPRNKEYCEKHGFKYVVIDNSVDLPLIKRGDIRWWKFHIIRDLIKSGKLKDGDIINCHDADTWIVDLNAKFESDKSFTYSICNANTHCTGWFSLKINDWVKNMINLAVDENRFNKLINKQTIHPRFKNYSSLWQIWADQACWYTLAGITRHSDIPFWDLPNLGYHSDVTEDTAFTIKELQENVKVLPTCYHITEWEGESSCEFNIIKNIKKEDVKLRHFAGGQPWVIDNWK